MPKLLARIVTLLLVSCLLADSALSALLLNTQINPPLVPGTKGGLKAVIFSEQALSPANAASQPNQISAGSRSITDEIAQELKKSIETDSPLFLGHLYGQFGDKPETEIIVPGTSRRISVRITRLYKKPKVLDQIAELIGKGQEGKSLLAIGVGTGAVEEVLVKQWKLHVNGVDVAWSMALEAAKKWINVAVAHAYQLPFLDSSFDIASMIESIGHMKEPDTAMAEISRVLKPGGIAHIVADKEDFPAVGYRGYTANNLITLLSRHGFEGFSEVVGLDGSEYAYVQAKKSAQLKNDALVETLEQPNTKGQQEFIRDLFEYLKKYLAVVRTECAILANLEVSKLPEAARLAFHRIMESQLAVYRLGNPTITPANFDQPSTFVSPESMRMFWAFSFIRPDLFFGWSINKKNPTVSVQEEIIKRITTAADLFEKLLTEQNIADLALSPLRSKIMQRIQEGLQAGRLETAA